MEDTFVRDYIIYKKVPKSEINYDKYYDFAEDEFGSLLKPHYGHDGDGDWYITCYTNLNTGSWQHGQIKYFYEAIGRIPFEYVYDFDWKEVKGLALSFEMIDGVEKPCFVKWNENKCYVIT